MQMVMSMLMLFGTMRRSFYQGGRRFNIICIVGQRTTYWRRLAFRGSTWLSGSMMNQYFMHMIDRKNVGIIRMHTKPYTKVEGASLMVVDYVSAKFQMAPISRWIKKCLSGDETREKLRWLFYK
jgi:hypothetical protein